MFVTLTRISLSLFSQAYTMELEAEIAKLKEENEELRQKQVTIICLLFKECLLVELIMYDDSLSTVFH